MLLPLSGESMQQGTQRRYSDKGTVSQQVQAPMGAYGGNNEQFLPDVRCPPGLPMVTDSYIPPVPVNNKNEVQRNQQ